MKTGLIVFWNEVFKSKRPEGSDSEKYPVHFSLFSLICDTSIELIPATPSPGRAVVLIQGQGSSID